MIFGKQRRFRKQRRQSENFAERHPRCRERPLRLRQKPSVSVEHTHPDTATVVGMLVVEIHTVAQRVAANYSVRVQYQREFAAGNGEPLVIGTSETGILPVFYHNHIGKTLFQMFYRVVTGIVVDHNNLARESSQRLLCRTHRLLKEILHPVVDNHYRNVYITVSCFHSIHLVELLKLSVNSVRFWIDRPSVTSSVYSISLPTATPRASIVIRTSLPASLRKM